MIKDSVILPPTGAVKLYFIVNTDRVQNDTYVALSQGSTTRLLCQYDRLFRQWSPSIIEVDHEGLQLSNLTVQPYTDPQRNIYVVHTVPANQATNQHIYRCVQTLQNQLIFVQVTIAFGGECTMGKY